VALDIVSFPVQQFPPFFAQTFSGLGTPLDAAGSLFSINIPAALPALDASFIGEDFHLIPALGTFM
jgi:hypothetical protein